MKNHEQVHRKVPTSPAPGVADVTVGHAPAPFRTAVPLTAPVRRVETGANDPLGGTAAAPEVTAALRRRRGQGVALAPEAAQQFGDAYGTDLSGVRIHTDLESDHIARSVQATAFTHGTDVYFSSGTYAGGSSGQQLLAHELAHVAQHQRGEFGPSGAGTTIGRANDPAEAAADSMAAGALSPIRRRLERASTVTEAAAESTALGTLSPIRRLAGEKKKPLAYTPTPLKTVTDGGRGAPPRETRARRGQMTDEQFMDYEQTGIDTISNGILGLVKEQGGGRTATPESTDFAKTIDDAAQLAAKTVTADVEAAMKLGGGTRKGGGHELKGAKGLAGKIASDLKEQRDKHDEDPVKNPAPDMSDVLGLAGDGLRFTICFDLDGFTKKVLDAMSFLEKQKYTAVAVKNTFVKKDAAYRGINTNWRAGNGVKWELQFHTQESFDLKDKVTHKPYEAFRNLDSKVKDQNGTREYLGGWMKNQARKVGTPDNLEDIGPRGQLNSVAPPAAEGVDPQIPEGIEKIKDR